jgi:tetratricopeptide (TPR) repeat protein
MLVYAFGACFQFLGKPAEAEVQFKKAIELHPDAVWLPYFGLGSIYQGRGSLAEAEKAYEKAIKNKPDYALAYNAIAWMYAEKGIKLDHAIELAVRALELSPEDGNILDTLGWAYYRKGDREQALNNRSPARRASRSHARSQTSRAATRCL